MRKLRGESVEWRNLRPGRDGRILKLPKGNSLELELESDWEFPKGLKLELNSGAEGASRLVVTLHDSEVKLMGMTLPLSNIKGQRKLHLRLFVDRSVAELFVNDVVCATKIISPLGTNSTLKASGESGELHLSLVKGWEMKTIW